MRTKYIDRFSPIPLHDLFLLVNVKERPRDNKAIRMAVLRMESRREGCLSAFTFSLVFEFDSIFTIFSYIT